jgi:hypothetical protein
MKYLAVGGQQCNIYANGANLMFFLWILYFKVEVKSVM